MFDYHRYKAYNIKVQLLTGHICVSNVRINSTAAYRGNAGSVAAIHHDGYYRVGMANESVTVCT